MFRTTPSLYKLNSKLLLHETGNKQTNKQTNIKAKSTTPDNIVESVLHFTSGEWLQKFERSSIIPGGCM